jgi:hypothetical protein
MQNIHSLSPGNKPLRQGIPGRFSALKNKGRMGEISEVAEGKMIHGRYGASLLHPLWKGKRNSILKRDGFACVNCKGTEDLQVHHRQYHFKVQENRFKDPWDYTDDLLVSLCRNCNSTGHQKYTIPIIHV